MTSSTPPSKERARRPLDALSLFLVIAMGTLLLMYLLDSSGQGDVLTHQERARTLRAHLTTLPQDCALYASGLDGATLSLRCTSTTAASTLPLLQGAAASSPLPTWIESIAIQDAAHTLICDASLSHCTPHTLPSRDALADSRRRPPR